MNNSKIQLISIIIVNWNGKKWINKCINSLQKQSYNNLEILIVDNGSTDGSVKHIKDNYKNVHVIESKINLGFAGGNNIGINAAKGKYILLLNNDAWIDPDFISKLYSFYKKGLYDVVGPMENDYNNSKFDKNISTIDFFGHTVIKKLNKQSFKKAFYKSGVCLLFKKSLYIQTGRFDNDFFMYEEEVDWFWRLHLLNKRVGIAENIFIHHFGAGSTGSGIKYYTFLWRNQNVLQMLLKNYSWYNLVWVLPIYFIQNIIEILFFLAILKPEFAYSYIQGWTYNIRYFSRTIKKRCWVQKNRLASDFKILKKMHFGFGKIIHLFSFLLTRHE